MSSDEIKKWLTPEEWKHYLSCQKEISIDPALEDELIVQFLESLASARAKSEERRAMMVKHEYVEKDKNYFTCLECGYSEYLNKDRHAPGCKWARAIEEGE